MKRLLIAAPSAVVRAGLESLVLSHVDYQVIASVAGIKEAMEAVDALRPDLALAAVQSAELWVSALGEGEPVRAVLLVEGATREWKTDLVRAGVRAILPRDAPAEAILASLDAAAADLALLDPRELESLVTAVSPQPSGEFGQPLSGREMEVLLLLADGEPNKTIAWKLNISEHTVKFHVASILGKLDAATRAEAVAIGIRRGLIPL